MTAYVGDVHLDFGREVELTKGDVGEEERNDTKGGQRKKAGQGTYTILMQLEVSLLSEQG
jgi:hypothetical protein